MPAPCMIRARTLFPRSVAGIDDLEHRAVRWARDLGAIGEDDADRVPAGLAGDLRDVGAVDAVVALVDGVLAELARACSLAGRRAEGACQELDPVAILHAVTLLVLG